MSFSVFLAAKYLKPKRSVASVITCVSILGVMLGVAAVIIVRSVMTGFGDEWEKKILSFKPHISILPSRGNVVAEEDRIAAAVILEDYIRGTKAAGAGPEAAEHG
jgi:lipoprotein-releasing system permease protein